MKLARLTCIVNNHTIHYIVGLLHLLSEKWTLACNFILDHWSMKWGRIRWTLSDWYRCCKFRKQNTKYSLSITCNKWKIHVIFFSSNAQKLCHITSCKRGLKHPVFNLRSIIQIVYACSRCWIVISLSHNWTFIAGKTKKIIQVFGSILLAYKVLIHLLLLS